MFIGLASNFIKKFYVCLSRRKRTVPGPTKNVQNNRLFYVLKLLTKKKIYCPSILNPDTMSLIDTQNQIIDYSLESFHSSMIEAGQIAWAFSSSALNGLQTDAAEKVLNNEHNLAIADQIGRLIFDGFNSRNQEYEQGLQALKNGIDDIYTETKEYYNSKDIYLITKDHYSYESMVKGLVTTMKNEVDLYLGFGVFKERVILPATDAINEHIQNSSTKAATMKDMEHRINDRFYNFSVTTSLTLMNQYARRINEIYVQYSTLIMMWVQYAGANDEITREFCKDRLEGSPGSIYHIDEVREWPQLYGGTYGQPDGWPGWIDPTDRGSIFVNCGGYNCRHAFVYIPAKDVPAIVKERAARKGLTV